MKTWEKILLYPIGLCLWLGDHAKKTGKFIERKSKPAIAMLVAVTMMLSLMPMMAFAGTDDLTTVTISGNTYYTDENGVMAYRYHDGNVVLYGYFANAWRQTVYGTGGFRTYLKVGDSTSYVTAEPYAVSNDIVLGLIPGIDLEFTNNGKTMQIIYTVTNTTGQAVTFSLGSGGDIQIGSDDYATITPFEDGTGFKMVSDYDVNANGDHAQFNFFAADYKGVTNVSDFWYGSFYSWASTTGAYWTGNYAKAAFYGSDKSQSGDIDSAASWHWADQTLPAGETATYSILIGIGGEDSDDAAESIYHKHCICGGLGSVGDHTTCGNVTWTAWDGTTAFPEGNVYLSDDVILSASISIADTVNLCLNGHTISAAGGNFDVRGTLNLCSCEDDGIIKRTTTTNPLISADAGATANLYNVTLDGGVVWSGVEDSVLLRGTMNAGTKTGSPLIDAGYQRTAGGHITLNSGVVLQNNECSDAGDGGAVTIGEDGSLAINGATIRNNAKTDGNAGAIKAYAGAQITLSSGEIYGNSAYKHGGAFQIFGGDSTDYADAVFTMNGGTIRNNKANGVGGGIAVSDYSQFIMNGGSIIDNATTDSQKRGGGVGFADANTAMSISGNAVISGNSANNLYIGTNSCNKLTVGTLGSNANVGVTMKSSSGGVFTIGGAAYANKFTSDNSAYAVAVNGNNLKLVKQFTVSFDKNGGTGSNDSVKVSDGDDYTLPSNPFTAPSGYQFKGWATSASGDVISSETITVTTDTTLYVIWEKIPAEAPSVQISENLTLIYGEFTNQKIIATVDKKEGYTYSYQWVNDDNLVIGEADTLNIADDTAAGIYNYACNIFAKRNDNGEYKAITIRDIWVKVNAKAIDNNSTNVTLSKTTFIYNGLEQKPAVAVTYNGNDLNEDTDYTLDWSADCKNAGSKTVTVNFKGNYSGSAQETFVIQKAPLTVTANNKTITYGDTPANNGVAYSGFVSNETEAVLNGTLSYGCAYSQYGDVGAYDITINGLTSDNYEITFAKGTLTVGQKEIGISWGATDFIYNGTAQKPTAAATDFVNGDELTLTVSGEQTNASDTAYTATVTDINGEKAGNYKLPSNVTANFTIAKADQTASVVNKENETISKKADGKLTDVSADMEYRAEGESTYTAITGNTVENLAAGKYYVRLRGDSNHNPSPDTEVIIAAGRKLTVTLPQNQVGYTVTASANELDYGEDITITLTVHDGYSKTADFKFICNDVDYTAQLGEGKTYTLSGLIADVTINVAGIADINEPTATIKLKDNNWNEFLNGLTFGLFFNETQTFTIDAADVNTGSGINKIYYYLSDKELTKAEVDAITDWTEYNGSVNVDPDKVFVIYAKVTDNAGNITYVNSNGIVLDAKAPAITEIENGGTYYGNTTFKANDAYFDGVTVDAKDVTLTDGTYAIVADNQEHTLVATDKAGNKTEYKITVYKNYTVTFKIDDETVGTETVGHGKNATLSNIPAKDGYDQTAPTWDKDGKNITADTEINAVYTINEYTITFMDEHGVCKTLTVKHGEKVTMPDVPTKDGYTVAWDKELDTVQEDVTVKAVYTEIPVVEEPSAPQTGDNSHMALWIALLFISGGAVITLTVVDRKKKAAKR